MVLTLSSGHNADPGASAQSAQSQSASEYPSRQIQDLERSARSQSANEHTDGRTYNTERAMVHVSVQTSSIPVQRASEHGDRLVQGSERNVLEEGPREHTPGRMHGDGRNGLVRGATEHTDRRTPESDPANEVIANLMTKVEQLSLCVEAERDKANRYLKDVENLYREKEESDQDAAHWKARARRYRQGRHSALVELDQLRFQFEQAMKERESIQVLSEQRRQELDAAQSYLNTADASSEQDVVRLVKNVNTEVFQMVRALSDSFQPLHFPRRDENADELVTELIGPSMLELFQSVSNCNDTLALETALQHTLILQINTMISTWDFDNGNETIPSLYDKILRSESQSVAGRWRAITRKNLPSPREDGWDSQDFCVEHVNRVLSSISIAAGGHTDVSGHGDSIREIIRTVFRLRKMVGEDIVGSNYLVTIGHSGDAFAPDSMDNAFPVKGQPAKVDMRVLCASELGLRRVEKVKGDADAVDRISEVVILKPKVVLEDFVMELGLGEQSHSDNVSDSAMRE